MHLMVRVDESKNIGIGHFMRCFAIAQSWNDRGGKVTFICHLENKFLLDRISDAGFAYLQVENSFPNPSDLHFTLDSINRNSRIWSDRNNDWLLLDGYHFGSHYQKKIMDECSNVASVAIFDDNGHQPYYHGNVLINHNVFAHEISYKCDPDTRLLLGADYAVIRKEFLKWNNFEKEIPDRATRVLITMGGSDPENVTLKVINAFDQIDRKTINVRVVVGPSNVHQETLERAAERSKHSIKLIFDEKNMPEQMGWADIALSSGGTTCLELAYMGLPAIIIVLADNQLNVAEGFENKGSALNLGWHDNVSGNQIAYTMDKLLDDRSRRMSMHTRAKRIVDGLGVERLINCLTGKS